MSQQLPQPRIAILVANGFDENHITAVQRAMTKEKLKFKTIAPEQGVANGWQNNNWGHYFAVDEVISTALGSDYDLLILIGGERGVTKLKTNPHTRRIVNHFLEARKPVAAIGAGVSLLTLSASSMGINVVCPVENVEEIKAAGMMVSDETMVNDGVVLTATGADLDAWVEGVMTLVAQCNVEAEEGAQAA